MKRTIAIAVFAAACQGGVAPTESDLEQGLTVFSQTRELGLVGMYAEGDKVVFFETRALPITDQLRQHYAEDGVELVHPNMAMRWSDAEGRAIAQNGEFEESHDFAPPEQWEATLDLTIKARGALAEAALDPEVAEERTRLVHMVASVPDAAARVVAPSDEDLAQLRDREVANGYLGYSWKSYFYVRKPSGVNFHQGTSWNNHRYYSGAWHYYNNKVQDNDVYSPDYECGGAWSYVQDYKSFASDHACEIHIDHSGRCSGTYAVCSGPWEQRFNCRSEALRMQVWVMGDVRCSSSGGMCDVSQGVPLGGAFCGIRTSCSSRSYC